MGTGMRRGKCARRALVAHLDRTPTGPFCALSALKAFGVNVSVVELSAALR